MPTFRFTHDELTLEVTAPDEAALDMRDVYGDGSRRSFDGSSIVISFELRRVTEERNAKLSYRILEGGTEVFAVSGYPGRAYRGGQRMPGFDPIVYRF